MADTNTPKRPIDAFVEYFNDIKPYHCKILEIIEKYNFTDDITVNIDDSTNFNITIANDPVCKGVGFGYIWDDCCGFDALQCCDFGDCEGGFGLIFDNSDLVNSSQILSVSAAEGKIIIPGDQSKDTNIQIKKIISPTSLSVIGDITSVLSMSKIFMIVPMNIYPYTIFNSTSVSIRGNHVNQILSTGEIILSDAYQNNGTYAVQSASFNNSLNYTLVNLATVAPGLNTSINGNLYVKSSSINNGLYAVDTYNFNGVDTIITLVASVKTLSLETIPTTIQFRTAFSINREVEIENNDPLNDDEYKISDVVYDPFQNQTIVYLRDVLSVDTGIIGQLNLYGYITQPGFDAGSLCDAPNKQTISVNFSEVLQIIKSSAPLPTPTPTSTPFPSPTPEPQPFPQFFARLNSDGSQDTSFVDLGFSNPQGPYNHSFEALDGKIYYIGGSGQSFSFVRLNNDGTLDSSFDDMGMTQDLNCITQTQDTKIYLSSYSNGFVRLNADGTLDNTYTILDFDNMSNSITQTQDGKIYVGGSFNTIDGNIYNRLARLNSDGTLDTSFVNIAFRNDVSKIYQTQDGKIYVGGFFASTDGGVAYDNLMRLNSDGTLDTSFTNLVIDYNVKYIIQTTDSKIYVSGNFGTVSSNTYNGIFRLNSDGTLDTSFTNPNLHYSPAPIYQTVDGKIYFGGSGLNPPPFYVLSRFNSDGTLDDTFEPLEWETPPLSDIRQGSDGKIYICDDFAS